MIINNSIPKGVLVAALILALGGCKQTTNSKLEEKASHLPPFPADSPEQWVCAAEPPPPSPEQIAALCKIPTGADNPAWGQPANLPTAPASINNLDAKNQYDLALRRFLREHTYRDLGWQADQEWRMTGPLVGEFPPDDEGEPQPLSYGVHPAVRIWYSPEVTRWLCAGRPEGELADGAMIIKEMHPIKAGALTIETRGDCLSINKPADKIDPTSWTVMIKDSQSSHDGWYWANPTASGDGNPPILTGSAVTSTDFFGPNTDHPERNPHWYPTGDLFGADGHMASVVTPYNQFGAYCMNCHASAESELTFASLENILGPGLRYRHFSRPDQLAASGESGAAHGRETLGDKNNRPWPFSNPLVTPSPGFTDFFGDLGPNNFGDAWAYRLPAETFDHVFPPTEGANQFLTSSNCIGCHDATVSNSEPPHMLIEDPETGAAVNVSPYAEWRASPMGLAGRDPIFFAQLESETNHLPEHAACIENTCLHCHGVMGQRQLGIDTHTGEDPCRDLFAIEPPAGVKFGEPFRLDYVTQFQSDEAYGHYGNLARDGISCQTCHRIAKAGLGEEAGYSGNWVPGPANEVYGPYEEVVTKPMEHSLDLTPKHASQIQDSNLCASCHNILLPVFNNDGTPHPITAPDGSKVTATYEQTTDLEWQNSDFARGDSFQSCQDCHMPHAYKSVDLAGTKIANIEASDFAPTTHRLPDEAIELTARDTYSRHALHGINLFLNEMFQQFPLLLGIRQIDYMGNIHTQPALVTASQSMQRMARQETADIDIQALNVNTTTGEVQATVTVTNKAGHYLPSGVGFRRLFIEFMVTDRDGELLWASGRTNPLGVILEGTSNTPLITEQGVKQTRFQPHYQIIARQDQVQIYQELIKDSEGYLTTSFLRRTHPVKDNRLRPRGFDPAFFRKNSSPFIQMLGDLEGKVAEDPHYYDPALTGSDEVQFQFTLTPQQAARIGKVSATLYSQSTPPFYLQQRFHDAGVGPAASDNIRRLYYMTSHLNTSPDTAIENWKVIVATAEARP